MKKEKMTYAEYKQIVEESTPNWSKADINRLTLDCYIKNLDKHEAIKYIKSFL